MNHKSTLALVAALAIVSLSAPAFAACQTIPTADNAPVYGDKVVAGGGNASLNGTAYTKATFCPPVSAANGTCTGESLSTKVDGHLVANAFLGNYGNVPDNHRNGIQIGPIFIPTTPVLPGACS